MVVQQNDEYQRSIRAAFELKETDELLRIQKEHNLRMWTPEALDMVDTILRERGIYPWSSYQAKETTEELAEEAEEEEDIYCLRCSTKIPSGAKFCPACGDYQWDDCMICDKPVSEEAKYCPYCGSLIKNQTNASKLSINSLESLHSKLLWGFFGIGLLLLWIIWQITSLGANINAIF